jgi:hypothetical protein
MIVLFCAALGSMPQQGKALSRYQRLAYRLLWLVVLTFHSCCCCCCCHRIAEMVSISTLFAFWMVALALIWHRYCQPQGPAPPTKHKAIVGAHMGIIVAASLGKLRC